MENIEILRSNLVEKIFSTKNISLLQAIDDILSSVSTKDEQYTFSESQKELLLLAEEDIKYGRTITDEELRKLDDEWMK